MIFLCNVEITFRFLFAHVSYAVNITVLTVSISISSKKSRKLTNAKKSIMRSLHQKSNICVFDSCTIYNLKLMLNYLMYSVTHTLMMLAEQATKVSQNFLESA